MEKRWSRVFVIILFFSFLVAMLSNNQMDDMEKEENIAKSELRDTEGINGTEIFNDTEINSEMATAASSGAEEDGSDSHPDYQFLDSDFFDRDFIDQMGGDLIERGMCDYSEEVKGEFMPVVPENCSFPEELVVMMEEAFYHSAADGAREVEDFYYDEKLQELGSDQFVLGLEEAYELFPKIADYKGQIEKERDAYRLIEELYVGQNPESCNAIWHFQQSGGQDHYLFSYGNGEKDPSVNLYLMERTRDEFVRIQSLYTASYGRRKLIQYGEEFYYVYLIFSDNTADYEGICIYKLNENPGEDTAALWIYYLPEEYIWRDLYVEFDNVAEEIREARESYIEEVKEELLYVDETKEQNGEPVRYLDFGRENSGWFVYYGDEKEGDFAELDGYTYYKVDIANCGLPVYVMKRPVNPGSHEILAVDFYCYDTGKASYEHLFAWGRYGRSTSDPVLVQVWFKEIGGKIYTFRIYHINEFNYLFSAVLLEGNRSTIVRTSAIAPKREFVVTEEMRDWD